MSIFMLCKYYYLACSCCR